MPEVDAVEVTQGNDWIHQSPRQAIDAENGFHVNSPRSCACSREILDFTRKEYRIKYCLFSIDLLENAEVAELADALDSGSSGRRPWGVQVPPSAPLFFCKKG